MNEIKKLERQNDKVVEFIERRFYKDCNWLDGNCYYFALILKGRFPDGGIYYDVIKGHFVYKYKDVYYDWVGVYEPENEKNMIRWQHFGEYDPYLKNIVDRDCIK